MGCPAKKVTGGYAGSALMREPDHALALIDAVVGAVTIPVTVKMRLGWDDGALNAPALARRAEDAGIAMVTVHGRTRCQFFQGKADWRAIGRVKAAVSVPVVANGDIADGAGVTEALTLSGADAVMIGRAACGAPWLPADHRRLAPRGPSVRGGDPCLRRRPLRGDAQALRHGKRSAQGAQASGLVSRPSCAWGGDAFAAGDSHGDRTDGRCRRLEDGVRYLRPGTEAGGMNVTPPASANLADAAQLVLNTIRHPVIMIGPDGFITFANADAEDFFRASAVVLARSTLSRFVPFGSPLLTLVDQVRERRAPVNEYRVDISSPRLGADKLVDIYVAPVTELPGSVVVMFQERSMADKIDRQMTHRGAARSVTGLAAMLAHEIKNPLSGIRGAAQLLETAVSDEDRALTRLITDETDRIVSLVDRMEVFSDERPIDRYPVNIHVVLDHVKAIARNGFARGIRLVEDYDPSLPPVYANRDQLIQVFLNLVKNAAEAIGGDQLGEITLSTAFRPGIRVSVPGTQDRVSLPLEFCVRDNGPGVSEDILPILFDPFITTKPNGSGLGLALVAKIVGEHGGVIECNSTPRGTQFRILLPAWKENVGQTSEIDRSHDT